MKKSKEGAAYIVTIIIFMFVTIVSVAFLSMITSNYYGRISESKRTQNLYGSESGLDTTHNIIVKNIEASSFYGNEKVKELKKAKDITYDEYKALTDNDKKALYALYADIEYWKYYNGNLEENQEPKDQVRIDNYIKNDNEDIEKLINKVFKNEFKSFFSNNLESSINDSSYIKLSKNNDGTFIEDKETLDVGDAEIYIGEESNNNVNLQSETTNTKNLKLYVDGDFLKSSKIISNSNGEIIEVNRELKVESGYEEDGRIKYDSYPLQFSFYNEENYDFKVISEFATNANVENTAKVGENLRIIQSDYSLRIPNYNEVAFRETVVVDSELNQLVGLTIGGDMDISSVNKLNVSGDIFVQGNDSDSINDMNRTFEKYSGGIVLDNSSVILKTINFNNNVYTRGTFNIKNNVDVVIKGDLYARNIYAGDENNLSDNSKLTINNEAVIDNDLTVKATDTQIKIKDFYGINDKNIDEDTKVRKSSSIIINDYKETDKEPSSITISEKAYIMGVAQIDTNEGYQTGESVAIRGNYKAYGAQIDQNEKFKYDYPLQVLDEDNVLKKAEHFYNYWINRLSEEDGLDCGRVNLPIDTYSIGAIVYEKDGIKNVTQSSTFLDNNLEVVVKMKRLKYARNIYKLGENSISDEEAKTLYETLGTGEKVETVESLLGGLSNLTNSDYNLENKINNGKEMAIFCPEQKTIVIKGKNSTSNYDSNSYMTIDASSNKDIKAVIITAGNVIIDGDVNFRGNIIAQGNLKVIGNSTVNLYYDKNVTEDIQNSNGILFNKVFGNRFGGEQINNETLTIESNASNFLKTKLWKITQ